MKKIWMVGFLCLCQLSFASPMQDHKINPESLSQLASALDIPEGANILAETQKRWLRKPGQERWHVVELSPEQKSFVLNWAIEQGLYKSWKPLESKYDKAFILGATTSRMEKRLKYLKELWEEGIRFSEVVWLTGDRPLDKQVDGLFERCSNESEAAHLLWEEAALPKEMRKLSVVFSATPMKKEGTVLRRPNTADTIQEWLKTTSKPCKLLFVSDQPFCGYQFAVIKGCLPDSFPFDVVGKGLDPTSSSGSGAVILDTVARWIYQENLNNK